MASEYERIRLRNIEDNKRILAELGLVNPFKPLPRIIKSSVKSFKRKREYADSPAAKRIKVDSSAAAAAATPGSGDDSTDHGRRRRSRRLLGKDAPEIKDIDDVTKAEEEDEEYSNDDDENDENVRPKIPKDRPHVYGAIPDVEVGTIWLTRLEANYAGVHRPTVAGIHPGPEGAYSIALSGGYEDDIDLGECFTYTGEGGRDLKGTKANPKNLRTAPQSKDQLLSRGNKALAESVTSGRPVRVLRGYKLRSPFAPEEGYRYDGLYRVDKWWYTTGLAGFGVYKFVLSRLKDQPPPPWSMGSEVPNFDEARLDENLDDLSNKDEKADDALEGKSSDKDEISSIVKEENLKEEKDLLKTEDTQKVVGTSCDNDSVENQNENSPLVCEEDNVAGRQSSKLTNAVDSDDVGIAKECSGVAGDGTSDNIEDNLKSSCEDVSSENPVDFKEAKATGESKELVENDSLDDPKSGDVCVTLNGGAAEHSQDGAFIANKTPGGTSDPDTKLPDVPESAKLISEKNEDENRNIIAN